MCIKPFYNYLKWLFTPSQIFFQYMHLHMWYFVYTTQELESQVSNTGDASNMSKFSSVSLAIIRGK